MINTDTLVPCGVAVLVVKTIGESRWILYGKRKGAHGASQWTFPGGKLKPNESPFMAASRELKEETGISIPARNINPYLNHPYNNCIAGGQPWVTLFVFTEVQENTKAKLIEPDKCEEWDWFLPTNPPIPLFEPARLLHENVSDPVADRTRYP